MERTNSRAGLNLLGSTDASNSVRAKQQPAGTGKTRGCRHVRVATDTSGRAGVAAHKQQTGHNGVLALRPGEKPTVRQRNVASPVPARKNAEAFGRVMALHNQGVPKRSQTDLQSAATQYQTAVEAGGSLATYGDPALANRFSHLENNRALQSLWKTENYETTIPLSYVCKGLSRVPPRVAYGHSRAPVARGSAQRTGGAARKKPTTGAPAAKKTASGTPAARRTGAGAPARRPAQPGRGSAKDWVVAADKYRERVFKTAVLLNDEDFLSKCPVECQNDLRVLGLKYANLFERLSNPDHLFQLAYAAALVDQAAEAAPPAPPPPPPQPPPVVTNDGATGGTADPALSVRSALQPGDADDSHGFVRGLSHPQKGRWNPSESSSETEDDDFAAPGRGSPPPPKAVGDGRPARPSGGPPSVVAQSGLQPATGTANTAPSTLSSAKASGGSPTDQLVDELQRKFQQPKPQPSATGAASTSVFDLLPDADDGSGSEPEGLGGLNELDGKTSKLEQIFTDEEEFARQVIKEEENDDGLDAKETSEADELDDLLQEFDTGGVAARRVVSPPKPNSAEEEEDDLDDVFSDLNFTATPADLDEDLKALHEDLYGPQTAPAAPRDSSQDEPYPGVNLVPSTPAELEDLLDAHGDQRFGASNYVGSNSLGRTDAAKAEIPRHLPRLPRLFQSKHSPKVLRAKHGSKYPKAGVVGPNTREFAAPKTDSPPPIRDPDPATAHVSNLIANILRPDAPKPPAPPTLQRASAAESPAADPQASWVGSVAPPSDALQPPSPLTSSASPQMPSRDPPPSPSSTPSGSGPLGVPPIGGADTTESNGRAAVVYQLDEEVLDRLSPPTSAPPPSAPPPKSAGLGFFGRLRGGKKGPKES